eukprot:7697113-Pyramimonas_sp.AAC.1
MVQYLKGARGDVKALYLSSHVIHLARTALVAYRARLDEVGRGPYIGGDTPSSGRQIDKSTPSHVLNHPPPVIIRAFAPLWVQSITQRLR